MRISLFFNNEFIFKDKSTYIPKCIYINIKNITRSYEQPVDM